MDNAVFAKENRELWDECDSSSWARLMSATR
jgi:hypothetical protein